MHDYLFLCVLSLSFCLFSFLSICLSLSPLFSFSLCFALDLHTPETELCVHVFLLWERKSCSCSKYGASLGVHIVEVTVLLGRQFLSRWLLQVVEWYNTFHKNVRFIDYLAPVRQGG